MHKSKEKRDNNVVCILTLALGKVPQWVFLIDPVLVDGIDVVLRRLQGAELGAQVTVLTAVRSPGAWPQHTRRQARVI